jgi:hypothetical protein
MALFDSTGPLTVSGRLFDRIVGQKLAARTMDDLLDQLAQIA